MKHNLQLNVPRNVKVQNVKISPSTVVKGGRYGKKLQSIFKEKRKAF